jgi:quinol monooxygenase YgiN
VVVGSFDCTITPTNKTEFLDAVAALMERTRVLRGCQACRLLADTEDPARFTFILEWTDREDLQRFLESEHYEVLTGMRYLMRGLPRFVVDEVSVRATIPMSGARL